MNKLDAALPNFDSTRELIAGNIIPSNFKLHKTQYEKFYSSSSVEIEWSVKGFEIPFEAGYSDANFVADSLLDSGLNMLFHKGKYY